MAQEITILSWDDLHLAEGRKIPADEPFGIRLAYGDKEVVLDMALGTRTELERVLDPYLAAGRKPEKPKVTAGRQTADGRKRSIPRPGIRVRNFEMRVFSLSDLYHGALPLPTGSTGRGGKPKSSTYYHPIELQDAFQAALDHGQWKIGQSPYPPTEQVKNEMHKRFTEAAQSRRRQRSG